MIPWYLTNNFKKSSNFIEYAKKHRSEIQNDPVFRAKFLEMCGPLGVDPLSSEKGFWGKMLGIGEFYYELAVKVAEVCIASRSRNGGIISVAEVKQILKERGTKFNFTASTSSKKQIKSTKYSTQDIKTAIGKLSKLGSGFRTVMVGNSCMIVSVPMELDNDHMEIMKLAQRDVDEKNDNDFRIENNLGGAVTCRKIMEATGWDANRTTRAIDILLSNGMAWLDIHDGKKSYWFPRYGLFFIACRRL